MSSDLIGIRRASPNTCCAAALFCALLCPAFVDAQSVVVVNQRQPFETELFDDCSGENIGVVAEDHVLIIQKVGKDGVPYWEESINTHGTATGLTSGNVYVYNETIRFNRPAEPGPECGFAIDFSTRLRMVSKGAFPDLFVKYFFNLEVSTSCIPTITESFESLCRGVSE
jgi:hypothetical protein